MTVTVDIDSKWVRFIRSPLYVVISSLAGVSVSFAPLFLYWSGQGKFFAGYERVIVPICFAVIYLVPFVYIRLGLIVAAKVREFPARAES
jgi:hypothetical protein